MIMKSNGNMKRRSLLKQGIAITAWITSIITTVSLPLHATTSISCSVPLVVQQIDGDNKDENTSGITPETGGGIVTKKGTLDGGTCSKDRKPMTISYKSTYTITDGAPRSIHIESYSEIYCGSLLSRTLYQNYNGTEPYPQRPNLWIGSYTLVVTSCTDRVTIS